MNTISTRESAPDVVKRAVHATELSAKVVSVVQKRMDLARQRFAERATAAFEAACARVLPRC